jgi:hypothetical protein
MAAKFNNHHLSVEEDSDSIAHIIPVDDLKPHTESKYCKCKPNIQHGDSYILVVHYSYDGREFFEDNPESGH